MATASSFLLIYLAAYFSPAEAVDEVRLCAHGQPKEDKAYLQCRTIGEVIYIQTISVAYTHGHGCAGDTCLFNRTGPESSFLSYVNRTCFQKQTFTIMLSNLLRTKFPVCGASGSARNTALIGYICRTSDSMISTNNTGDTISDDGISAGEDHWLVTILVPVLCSALLLTLIAITITIVIVRKRRQRANNMPKKGQIAAKASIYSGYLEPIHQQKGTQEQDYMEVTEPLSPKDPLAGSRTDAESRRHYESLSVIEDPALYTTLQSGTGGHLNDK